MSYGSRATILRIHANISRLSGEKLKQGDMTGTSAGDKVEVTVGQGPVLVIYRGGGGNCRTGTSTCDLGEVTVGHGQGPVVLVLRLHYFFLHTKLELYKRKTTVEK